MTFLANLSLGKKITLLTVVGLILGIGVLSALGMRAVSQASEAMLQDRLTTAGLLADHLDETLSHAVANLEHAAQLINLRDSRETLRQQMAALQDSYARLSIPADGIYLGSRDGVVLACMPENRQALDLASYPTVTDAFRTGQTLISGLSRIPLFDTPVILIATPLPAGEGVLVVSIDPAGSSIGGFVKPIKLGQTGYVEVVDQNGTVITRTEPGPKLSRFEQSDHSGRFAALIATSKATRGVCHTCHETQQVERRDVLAFAPLSRAKWGVVIRQSEQEALAPVQELRSSLILCAVGLVVTAFLFVLITTRNVTRRLGILTHASRRIADGDLSGFVPASGKDEVGILSNAFNEMRVKLQNSYGDLERKTKELASLLSVTEILNSTLPLPAALQAVVTKAVEVIPGADAGALLLAGGDSTLRVESLVGLERIVGSLPCSPNIPQTDIGASSNAVTAFVNSFHLAATVKSSISAEVSQQGQCSGLLVLLSFSDASAFARPERRLLQGIADNIAVVLEKDRLSQQAAEASALHEAEKLRKEFISSVSHELRTPLTLIKGYSTSLLREDTCWDVTSQRQFLRIIDEKTDELRDLIDKLLESAKLEAGALRLNKEPVLIPHVARKVLEEISPRARSHNFVLDFVHPFPVIEADLRCIKQVIHNLVDNAVKYSPEGTEVKITGEIQESTVVVGVKDSGLGIPAEHKGKIFDRFYRVQTTMTQGIAGSGLGLAIVKGHVEAHGGRVWFESEAGKGSTFYFSLPLDTGRRESDE